MDYLDKICQRKFFICLGKALLFFGGLIAVSCSVVEKHNVKIPIVEPIPQWLKAAERFSHRSEDGYFETHSFFDAIPFPDLKTRQINFILTTPVGSEYGYDIDLQSGQIYKNRDFCPQKDIWRSYKGSLHKPPYSEGFIPRVLDQLGDPLKIVVFGGKRYLSKASPRRPLSQRVQVIGGIIQQYCEKFPCARRSEWLSRLILVAVNHIDPKFQKIVNLEQLKKKIKWEKFKGFIENGHGRQVNGIDEQPAYRMFGAISAKEAFEYALKKGHLFKFEEMKKLRRGCHRLYDHIWKQASRLRLNREKQNYISSSSGQVDTNSLVVDTKKSIFIDKNKSGPQNSKKFTKQELEAPLVGAKQFLDFFNNDFRPFGDRLSTCMEYVRAFKCVEGFEAPLVF